uniref:hypothetical protein n=1 Tax=Candidatus Ichthyocystis sparus TaxID=1561004 RepID=UPI003B969A22
MPCRSDRTSKHNQLIRIGEELGRGCYFSGKDTRLPRPRGGTSRHLSLSSLLPLTLVLLRQGFILIVRYHRNPF